MMIGDVVLVVDLSI